jgi:hypothetical protein
MKQLKKELMVVVRDLKKLSQEILSWAISLRVRMELI